MFSIISAFSTLNSRRARVIVVALTLVVLVVLVVGPMAIAQAGPATGGSVCPGCP